MQFNQLLPKMGVDTRFAEIHHVLARCSPFASRDSKLSGSPCRKLGSCCPQPTCWICAATCAQRFRVHSKPRERIELLDAVSTAPLLVSNLSRMLTRCNKDEVDQALTRPRKLAPQASPRAEWPRTIRVGEESPAMSSRYCKCASRQSDPADD